MYPLLRLTKQVILNKYAARLEVGETHLAYMRAWPCDIDVFLDLNNGRLLTLMDLGRMGYFVHIEALKVLQEKGWYGTVAGSAVRYRRRITMMQRLELRTRVVGWDDRFTYFDQSFWRGDECCAQAMIRTAISNGRGIVPSAEVADALDIGQHSPTLPDWVKAWDQAEQQRPWPPERVA